MPENRWDFVLALTEKFCKLGKSSRDLPSVGQVQPFRQFFSEGGELLHDELDNEEGEYTRREILARYLLVSVVLDQGPDIPGVRQLLKGVTERLYSLDIRIFHDPAVFFDHLGTAMDTIVEQHESARAARAEDWARANRSDASRYNLFFAQSPRGIISTHQVLDYTLHRWGVPLSVPLLLQNDADASGKSSKEPLVEYLESHPSAEVMANKLKDHDRYGLGSAIGDKACHLFAKMYVSVLQLVRRVGDEGWGDISYEIPFDSNAGRVLFRTGFLLELASLDDYEGWDVIQKRLGKGGKHYIRVTNIRDRKTGRVLGDSELFADYVHIVVSHLKMGGRPRSVAIQRLPNLLVHKLREKGQAFSIADFDDGLIKIGTKYCFNHPDPNCNDCPVNSLCVGKAKRRDLIVHYAT